MLRIRYSDADLVLMYVDPTDSRKKYQKDVPLSHSTVLHHFGFTLYSATISPMGTTDSLGVLIIAYLL
jgi:hypothetical protein